MKYDCWDGAWRAEQSRLRIEAPDPGDAAENYAAQALAGDDHWTESLDVSVREVGASVVRRFRVNVDWRPEYKAEELRDDAA